jgi:hypothetical protein
MPPVLFVLQKKELFWQSHCLSKFIPIVEPTSTSELPMSVDASQGVLAKLLDE